MAKITYAPAWSAKDRARLVMLYNSMVRSHFDYCSSVWAPYKKGDIEALEKVQKKATKILPALRRIMDFSFPCTFAPLSKSSKQRTFAP